MDIGEDEEQKEGGGGQRKNGDKLMWRKMEEIVDPG